MRTALLIAMLLLARISFAQNTNTAPPPDAPAKPVASSAKTTKPTTTAQMQAAIDRLTQSNRDLLDLLKEQQSVLQDIQYDRRQQSRHIQSLEERLTDALQENAQLQKKIADMAADAASHPAIPLQPLPGPTNAAAAVQTPPPIHTPPPEPEVKRPDTYLPPPPPDSSGWHRIFSLKGTESQQTEPFHIRSKTWRLVWHNQDPAGKNLQGTAGLFVDVFPKDDTIPQHACAKVGSGGDTAELVGPGNYFLKITASGGSWELAVEDYH